MANSDSLLASMGNDARELVKRTWWVFLVGGIAMLLFGLLAFVKPGIALLVLSMFFAASILVDGAFNVVGSISNRDKDGWWIMLLIGLLGLGGGAFALLNPPISMLAFVLLVAIEAIALGVFLILLGWRVRKATSREWVLYLTGALSLLFGLLVLLRPMQGGISIVYIIATWAVLLGGLKIYFSFKARRLAAHGGARLFR
jgi:uncharacterized membrane protein HdeD (DUF308 family)